jgi:ABC-type enterochelin transport system permease subunit
MPVALRLLHIAAAVLFGVAISSMVALFGSVVDPSEYAAMQPIHWLMPIMFFGAPLWIPAAIPSKYPRLLHAVRLTGAALLVVPTLVSATVIPHNFLFGAAATLSCAAFLALALWPEIHALAHRST